MTRRKELTTEAQNFVRETMLRARGQQPTKRAIKQAADRIVQALEPILNHAASSSSRRVARPA